MIICMIMWVCVITSSHFGNSIMSYVMCLLCSDMTHASFCTLRLHLTPSPRLLHLIGQPWNRKESNRRAPHTPPPHSLQSLHNPRTPVHMRHHTRWCTRNPRITRKVERITPNPPFYRQCRARYPVQKMVQRYVDPGREMG